MHLASVPNLHDEDAQGVVARIVTGPHDANQQDSYLPMRYDAGRPTAVIRLRISQPRTTSLSCVSRHGKCYRERQVVAPQMTVYPKNACLHPALTMVPAPGTSGADTSVLAQMRGRSDPERATRRPWRDGRLAGTEAMTTVAPRALAVS